MKPKTIIISGGDKGGSGKTACLSAFVDALIALGYSVRLIDADSATQTLTAIFPNRVVNSIATDTEHASKELDKALKDIADNMTEDIAVIDMPGGGSTFVKKYFENKTTKDFEGVGLRIIVAVTAANNARILKGVRAWLLEFAGTFPLICFKNNMAIGESGQFDLTKTNTGNAIIKLAGDHIIEIPSMNMDMKSEYDACFAVPSEFLLGGRATTKLSLFPLRCIDWNIHHNKIIAAVASHAEWTTGKPIPNPPEVIHAKVDKVVASYLDKMSEDDL